MKCVIQIVNNKTKEIVKEIPCSSEKSAERVERRILINLNHEKYYTKLQKLVPVTTKNEVIDKHKFKNEFILTIQFYKDKDGQLCLLQTNEDGISDSEFLGMDLFGAQLANSELLNLNDLIHLRTFCDQFIKSSITREAAACEAYK